MVIFFDIQKRHVDGFSKSFWKSNETLAAFMGLSDEAGDAILAHLFVSFGRRKKKKKIVFWSTDEGVWAQQHHVDGV